MNDTDYISIKCQSKELLDKAIQQLANLYSATEYSQGIDLYQSVKENDHYVIRFSNEPDFEHFKYFVNYLHYPQLQNYNAKVYGYFSLNESNLDLEHLENKRIQIYVSEKDTEGDNVNAIFEDGNQTLKLGFAIGEEYTELGFKEFDFHEPKLSNEEFEYVKSVNGTQRESNSQKTGCLSMVSLIITVIGLILLLK
jgi:hypothetical protein